MIFVWSTINEQCYHFNFTDKIFSSSSSAQVHSKANLQTGIEKKKNSHLITTSSTQSAFANGDKSTKTIEPKPNFLVPKPTFGSSKSPKMEKNNVGGAQVAAGTKNAPRLPPKPSKRNILFKSE